MGNCRVRLSDMIPIAWFYKLKHVTRTTRNTTGTGRRNSATDEVRRPIDKSRHSSFSSFSSPSPSSSSFYSTIPKQMQPPPLKPGRASYYVPRNGSWSEDKLPSSPVNPKILDTRFLADPPRKSSMKKRRGGRPQVCSATIHEETPEYPPLISETHHHRIRLSDGISGFDDRSVNRVSSDEDLVLVPPILTKPVVKKIEPGWQRKPDRSGGISARRRSFAGIQRLRMRVNTPRIAAKRKTAATTTTAVGSRSRKSAAGTTPPPPAAKFLSASFVIVKSSVDPHREFRESMVEMIIANNIISGKDLEELLACYLSLNSKEYHDVIVKVFQQIWFDLSNLRKH